MHLIAVNAGADVSGAERVLVDLLRHAVSQGDRVTLVCPEGALPDLLSGQVEHVPVALNRLGRAKGLRRWGEILQLPLTWWRVGRKLRRLSAGADALISNSTFALPAIGMAYPGRSLRRRSAPWVSWLVHDTIQSGKQRMVLRLGAPALDVAVAVSEVTAASVRPMLGKVGGQSGGKVVVRPNGVVVPAQLTGTTRARKGAPVVGILAVLTSWKGQDVLLEAVARLPEVSLEIAGTVFPGSEDFEAQLRSRAAAPDLAGRVRFLGQVDRAEVFPRWDLLISASTAPEAGPLGVLEAMAAGVPVIATDHGGAAEYLRDGAGTLVAPGDAVALAEAIRELLADPNRVREQRAKARSVILERHDLRDTLPKMLAALTHG
ncbi:glycosyltransferase family 4 protein [Corynebacterium sp. A21]|uniref:glycosyltransferase family 4 protein n=1 Tax=Corynebacterium sp. A21 TaxID=3457318 RepID=UPI003FD3B33F